MSGQRQPPHNQSIRLGQVDLSAIALAETEDGPATSTFLAIPFGEWDHPLYGRLAFFREKCERMKQHFDERVMGIDLSIDYQHFAEFGGKAAGWIAAMDVRDDGLYYTVEWTPAGAKALREREFRYFSPEYFPFWRHPKRPDVELEDVPMGGGVTNRPFLKCLAGEKQLEVALAEFVGPLGAATGGEAGDETMKFEDLWNALRPRLGLGENAKPDEVAAKLAGSAATPGAPVPEKPGEPPAGSAQGAPAPATAEQLDPGVRQQLAEMETKFEQRLTELNAQNVALQERLKAQETTAAQRAAEANRSRALAAVETAVAQGKLAPSVLLDERGEDGTPKPSQAKQAMLAFAEGNPEGFAAFVAAQPTIPGFDPKGFGHRESGEAAPQSFTERAAALARQQGIGLAEAAEQLAQQCPDAYEAHRARMTGRAH